MKKVLFIAMMCFMCLGAFTSTRALAYFSCTVNYKVIDEEGNTVWGRYVAGDTCEQAIKIAMWAYWFEIGGRAIKQV